MLWVRQKTKSKWQTQFVPKFMAAQRNLKQELLVCGHIREIEKLYNVRKIPFAINDIIYLYQNTCDKWSKTYSCEDIKIDEFGSIIVVEADAW